MDTYATLLRLKGDVEGLLEREEKLLARVGQLELQLESQQSQSPAPEFNYEVVTSSSRSKPRAKSAAS